MAQSKSKSKSRKYGESYSVQQNVRGWEVMRDGAVRASSVHGTKTEATQEGKRLAMKSRGELRIKGASNRIQDSDSYGNDPRRSKDRKH